MKIQSLLLMSHFATATAVAVAVAGAHFTAAGVGTWLAASAAAATAVAGVSWYVAKQLCDHLQTLRTVATDPGEITFATTGIREFDHTAAQLVKHASRLEEIAANGREQMRDVQAVLALLDRRGGSRSSGGGELRQLLASIGFTLQNNLEQLGNSATELNRWTQEIAEGAETQMNAVIKTGTYVEQLSNHVDAISGDTKKVREAILETRRSAQEGLNLVHQLAGGVERIRVQALASEKKLRGLHDPSQQIRSIVANIGDIASRTDLLALNASIESIRAGEHGRGFAVVADEVRKLAEQTAEASREIAGLIESMQLAIQDSLSALAEGRSEVDAEVQLTVGMEQMLSGICGTTEADASCAADVVQSAHRQLQLMQDLVLAIEQVSEVAKTSRGRAENAGWALKTLTKLTGDVSKSVDPLRRCSDRQRGSTDGPASDAVESRREKPRKPSRSVPVTLQSLPVDSGTAPPVVGGPQ